ncbi:BolA family protein [Ideonella livida]|uniref:BolA family transcriptional regulator n=1 Tax=Ideonella livida TaxID=2707176 RepID=A0A7C9TJ31_9BURK|nr:BolA family protein [Ideonella livida]NDY90764.1 BolA family transcriptional regulator [Ideonella livida]
MSRPHVSAQAVHAALQAALAPLSLVVHDDSADHAGHAGAREGSHLRVEITCQRFSGLSRVARHRLVYDALRSLMPQGIHALAIQARSPGEP